MMLAVAYLWIAIALVMWAVDVVRNPPTHRGQQLIIFLLLLMFFPIGLLFLPLILNRFEKEEEPESAFPI